MARGRIFSAIPRNTLLRETGSTGVRGPSLLVSILLAATNRERLRLLIDR
jgi:hypothetical protein